jgi:hypothetical protein
MDLSKTTTSNDTPSHPFSGRANCEVCGNRMAWISPGKWHCDYCAAEKLKGKKIELKLQQVWEERARLCAEADKLYAEACKLQSKSNKLYAEDSKFYAEADKLYAESNLLWATKILETYGNTKMAWIGRGDCWVDVNGGETYKVIKNEMQ